MFWLIGIVIAGAATVCIGRCGPRSMTRLGLVSAGLGIVGWLLVPVFPYLWVALLGTLFTVYGIVVFIGSLAMMRCGRQAEL
jgi:hypothetical protein